MGNELAKFTTQLDLCCSSPADVRGALEHVDWCLFFQSGTLDDLESFDAFVDKVRDALRVTIADKCKPLEVLPESAQSIVAAATAE